MTYVFHETKRGILPFIFGIVLGGLVAYGGWSLFGSWSELVHAGNAGGTGYVGLFSIMLMILGAVLLVFSINSVLHRKPHLVITTESIEGSGKGLTNWKMPWSQIERADVALATYGRNASWVLRLFPKGRDPNVPIDQDVTIRSLHSPNYAQFDEIVRIVSERVPLLDARVGLPKNAGEAQKYRDKEERIRQLSIIEYNKRLRNDPNYKCEICGKFGMECKGHDE
ncbi:hypothetical protein D4R54_01125 [archaeon]|nr:MAG: hypothetical protein D4R54_01125 [archaeon]